MDIWWTYCNFIFILNLFYDKINQQVNFKRKENKIMKDSKLILIGRSLDDIDREFQVLLNKMRNGYHVREYQDKNLEKQIHEAWNSDLDGWINFFESIKIK